MKLNTRIYDQKEVVTFRSTKELFGGLSNMASGYSIKVNEVIIRSSEALYQACRYPLFPGIQEEIIRQSSPMTAKMISKKYTQFTRQDWASIRFRVMEWCLMVKLSQNWDTFSNILRATENKSIVEFSKKDKVWAATPITGGRLEGVNALGRLLMKIREEFVLNDICPDCVDPPAISGALLFSHPIEIVCSKKVEMLQYEFA